MYTSTIGRTFLDAYNREYGKKYSAKEFFEQELFSAIFDAKRYLMWAQNSPFVQGIKKSKPFFEAMERQEKLSQFHEKVAQGEADASMALAYPAAAHKEFATTSGQVSDLALPIDEEMVYLSWLGGCLGLGVAGGYTLLFNDAKILLKTFEGWKYYRAYLENPVLEKLRPNQLITWNGQWLTYCMGKFFSEEVSFEALSREGIFSQSEQKIEVNTVFWSRLFFSLSHQLGAENLTAYIYALGQTNKTVGFIPFQLQKGKRLHQVYQKLFGEDGFQTNSKDFEALFGQHIKRACELGSIGLQALEPKNLRKYFQNGKNLKLTRPEVKPKANEAAADFTIRKNIATQKDQENIITFRTYKTWLITMLAKNKQELSDYTTSIAQALVRYREGARKTDRKNLLDKKLLVAKNKNSFFEALITIVEEKDELPSDIIEKMKELRDRVHLMSQEDFKYFILLLRFDYAYQERMSQS